MVPNPAVMHVLFNLPVEKKVWKQKKLALADFEDITGRIYASVSGPNACCYGPSHYFTLLLRFDMDL